MAELSADLLRGRIDGAEGRGRAAVRPQHRATARIGALADAAAVLAGTAGTTIVAVCRVDVRSRMTRTAAAANRDQLAAAADHR